MWRRVRSGQPKIVNTCQCDVTGTGCSDLVVTDLAVIERDGHGLALRGCAPGFDPDDIVNLTQAPLMVSP